ncbi:hypothetical protein BGZ83_003995 [Gryganskiella cystojenkinii]|nr:hypothetical protein BGZ83_003995 [Gryganskiella cystojenkinii]
MDNWPMSLATEVMLRQLVRKSRQSEQVKDAVIGSLEIDLQLVTERLEITERSSAAKDKLIQDLEVSKQILEQGLKLYGDMKKASMEELIHLYEKQHQVELQELKRQARHRERFVNILKRHIRSLEDRTKTRKQAGHDSGHDHGDIDESTSDNASDKKDPTERIRRVTFGRLNRLIDRVKVILWDDSRVVIKRETFSLECGLKPEPSLMDREVTIGVDKFSVSSKDKKKLPSSPLSSLSCLSPSFTLEKAIKMINTLKTELADRDETMNLLMESGRSVFKALEKRDADLRQHQVEIEDSDLQHQKDLAQKDAQLELFKEQFKHQSNSFFLYHEELQLKDTALQQCQEKLKLKDATLQQCRADLRIERDRADRSTVDTDRSTALLRGCQKALESARARIKQLEAETRERDLLADETFCNDDGDGDENRNGDGIDSHTHSNHQDSDSGQSRQQGQGLNSRNPMIRQPQPQRSRNYGSAIVVLS